MWPSLLCDDFAWSLPLHQCPQLAHFRPATAFKGMTNGGGPSFSALGTVQVVRTPDPNASSSSSEVAEPVIDSVVRYLLFANEDNVLLLATQVAAPDPQPGRTTSATFDARSPVGSAHVRAKSVPELQAVATRLTDSTDSTERQIGATLLRKVGTGSPARRGIATST